ncbi:hypothetical protein BKA67DRAFT_566464 [Truncatella angustata]|uniref:Phosphoglycerate mutase n=1 Tax=Truncatella angustata TaxID=152316 RepID=A0A9P8ULP6_9PEZI|nr:uncharacterized protein BKA67DRAFT_566464 [Truncatella angustata]KAH6654865.1 hypothetical protein BKA67DRAFT_566464 [Truncatella angustata]
MPPLIHIIRHAKASHNHCRNNKLPDPDLTHDTPDSESYNDGHQQVRQLASYVNAHRRPHITHVVSSPSQRAVRTAQIVLEDVLRGAEGQCHKICELFLFSSSCFPHLPGLRIL